MPLNKRGSPQVCTHDIMLVQESLKVAGFYDGPIDGHVGKETKRAVRAYKQRHHIAIDNSLEADFIAHLRERA